MAFTTYQGRLVRQMFGSCLVGQSLQSVMMGKNWMIQIWREKPLDIRSDTGIEPL